MRMKKIDFTLVVIVGLVALSFCFSFATPIYSYGSPVLAWSTDPSVTENESIDVAHTDCTAEGSYLTITVYNAYPGYESAIVGQVVNTAGFPIKLSDLTLTNQHPDFITVTATRSDTSSVAPGDSFAVNVNLQVTDQAEQNRIGETAYIFDIVLSAQQQSGEDNGNGGNNSNGGNNGNGGDNGNGGAGGSNGDSDIEKEDDSVSNDEPLNLETQPEPPFIVPEDRQGTLPIPVETLPQGELPRTGSNSVLWFASALSLITAGLMTRFKYFN